MALLTTKGVYGLVAIFEVAKASQISPITINEISTHSGISRGYLEQILNNLRNAKIISSIKGKGGGYYLKKSLDDITFYDVLSTLEKDLKFTTIETKNKALTMLFEKADEKIKELLNLPLSKIDKFEKDSVKYLNFII